MKIVSFLLIALLGAETLASPKYWVERYGGFGGYEYLTDGEHHYSAGIFGTYDIDSIVKNNPDFSKDYEHLQKWRTIRNWTYWSGFGLVIASLFFRDQGTELAVLLGGAGILIYSIHPMQKTREYMFRIINRLNGINVPDEVSSFRVRPMSPSGVATLGFEIQF